METKTYSSFEEGILELFSHTLNRVRAKKYNHRVIRTSSLTFKDLHTNRQHTIKVSLVLEPTLFMSTEYPPEDAPFTTATVEQLKQMEVDNDPTIH